MVSIKFFSLNFPKSQNGSYWNIFNKFLINQKFKRRNKLYYFFYMFTFSPFPSLHNILFPFLFFNFFQYPLSLSLFFYHTLRSLLHFIYLLILHNYSLFHPSLFVKSQNSLMIIILSKFVTTPFNFFDFSYVVRATFIRN